MTDKELVIRFDAGFSGIRVSKKTLLPVHWDIHFELVLNSEKGLDEDFNFSVVKMNFWLDQIINNATFYCPENAWAKRILKNTDSNIVMCPLEPTDEHIAALIQSKANALGIGIFEVAFTEIRSDSCNGVTIGIIDGHESLPEMNKWVGKKTYFEKPWWDRNDASSLDTIPEKDADLNDLPEYAFALDFLRENNENDRSNIIIHPKFSSFRPRIVVDNDK